METLKLRNIAIIAHIDHGKTTLVDKLLHATDSLARGQAQDRVMDSNALEKERGITILAKNTAISWRDYRINVVDTPGHADFGGEVERIMSMVDSVLLLVDAVDGPMPQTRFVTQKAFKHGLKPVVVINKIDRPGARPDWVVDQVFDLFDQLGATDEQLDFPVLYASALEGYAMKELTDPQENMAPLLDAIIEHTPPPEVELEGPFQMQVSALDYSSYLGAIGLGRITRGEIRTPAAITVIDREGNERQAKISSMMGYQGLERVTIEHAQAGDIVAVTGIENIRISDTLCDPEQVEALPSLTVDEPTISMTFQVNDSPFAGKEGKFVTSRQIRDRLMKELIHNVALRVDETGSPDKLLVSGRGELHLGILIETMRREGYEFAVSRPQVISKEIDGVMSEPYETLTVDIQQDHQGSVIEQLTNRKGTLQNMTPDAHGRVRLDFIIPARGLIGFYPQFLTLTSGTGLLYHTFDHYGPAITTPITSRQYGVLISNAQGKSTGYSLWKIEARGQLMLGPQTEVYEGMIVGIHSRDNDLIVNVTKEKQLTNVRASGSDENITLTPPKVFSLEQSLAFIADDELVEITPENIRIRKKFLKEHERKRDSRQS